MASQSQGIQQLLQAEKVADARKRKARCLKQAKEEARMEVELYHREREEPAVGLEPGTPGSHPGPKAGTKPLSHPEISPG
uniref:V-type proton ATPase subunit G n=1 Tax=Canis lupus familiaris TaxID=9615 RepID=A0A8C0N301_CANLF